MNPREVGMMSMILLVETKMNRYRPIDYVVFAVLALLGALLMYVFLAVACNLYLPEWFRWWLQTTPDPRYHNIIIHKR